VQKNAFQNTGEPAQTLPIGQGSGDGISIRGLAGLTVVMASNFAPGTTSADIQSAMEPVGGRMQSCRIITASPTVIAEMVFMERSGAENVIATFNGQKVMRDLVPGVYRLKGF
jgi:hypothetical protein